MTKTANEIEECQNQICDFIESAPGLSCDANKEALINITQRVDSKAIVINTEKVEEILSRIDSVGKNFLQINFHNGEKILLTQNLVGFKPLASHGLDMEKVPKVVTTPDLMSIIEAIEESMSGEDSHPVEIDILRNVYKAVLDGGEAIGFDLKKERAWLCRITSLDSSVA